MTTWDWEEIDAGRSGSSGDLAKLFKNEGTKNPGALKVGAPPSDATLLAREAIQNSWDAGRALAKELETEGASEIPEFVMRFRYLAFTGDDKQNIIDTLALEELAHRASPDKRRKLGLGERDDLCELDQIEEPLDLLVIEEEGTTGMGGPWKGAASKLYLALVSIGFTVKAEGSGGSYGYGKAGLIRASATRTVVAHTCFREDPADPGVTRRLLGMTYWGLHEVGDTSYTGFARYGVSEDDVVLPFENDAADDLARALGLPMRDPTKVSDLGSTFLLLDPIVRPEDLLTAIERNWWPAIEAARIRIEVHTADGEVHHPRPKRDDVLKTFIRGYEVATESQDNNPEDEFKKRLKPYTPVGSQRYELGDLGLLADRTGWSYAQGGGGDDDEGGIDHQSLVALVRGPRMVVEYLSTGRVQPHIRGTFVADEAVDDLLRQTEPKAHDAWLPKVEEEGVDPDAPKVADQVLKKIRQHVREFRKQLKPPPTREQDIHLPLLNDLFRGILQNKGDKPPPPPPGDPRLVAIRVDQHVEGASEDRIRIRAKIRFNLTERVDTPTARCRMSFRYAFEEADRLGDDCPLSVDVPSGFELVDHPGKAILLIGDLGHESMEVQLHSEPYDPDWTGRLIVSGDVEAALDPATTPEVDDDE